MKRTIFKAGRYLLTLFFAVLVMAVTVQAAAAPARPAWVKAYADEKKATLKWQRTGNTTGYKIYEVKPDGSLKYKKTIKSSKTTKTTINGLRNGKEYSFVVVSYKKRGSKIYKSDPSNICKVTPRPAAPSTVTGLNGTELNERLKVSWRKASKATSYEIYVKTGDADFTKVAVTKGTSVQLSGLQNGTSYMIRIRSVRKSGGMTVYGKYSSTITLAPGKVGTSKVHEAMYRGTIRRTVEAEGANSGSRVTIKRGTSVQVIGRDNAGYSLVKWNGKYFMVPTGAVYRGSMITKYNAYNNKDAATFVNDRGYTSKTGYMIWVSLYSQKIFVFKKTNGKWKTIASSNCTTGSSSNPSYVGVTQIFGHSRYWYFEGQRCAEYASGIPYGAIHSWSYTGSLGRGPASHGCVRVPMSMALRIYKLKAGTTVVLL